MGKLVDDTVLDGALNIIKNNTTQVAVCATQPTNYTQATSTYMLALKTGLTAGDFTVSDGDTNGRKVRMGTQSNISITNSGSAQHVALCASSTTLYYVTTCSTQALTSGGTVTVPAWDVEIADPTP